MTNDSCVDSIRRYISQAIRGFPQKITGQLVNSKSRRTHTKYVSKTKLTCSAVPAVEAEFVFNFFALNRHEVIFCILIVAQSGLGLWMQ